MAVTTGLAEMRNEVQVIHKDQLDSTKEKVLWLNYEQVQKREKGYMETSINF